MRIFDGSTYKLSRGGMTLEGCPWRIKFKADRNASVITRMLALRKVQEGRGLYPTMTSLCAALALEIDITKKAIVNIIFDEGAGKSLQPSKGVSYKPRRISLVVPEVKAINYNTCAW